MQPREPRDGLRATAQAWLDKAAGDLEAARTCLAGERVPAWIAYPLLTPTPTTRDEVVPMIDAAARAVDALAGALGMGRDRT